VSSPAADLEARATRETQRLEVIIHDLEMVALAAHPLPRDIRRRLVRAIAVERDPLIKAREALDGYRRSMRDTRANTWHTEGDR
jgi:hypothetical protein